MTCMIFSLVSCIRSSILWSLPRLERALCILGAIAVTSMGQRAKNAQKTLCHVSFATAHYWLRLMGAGSGLEVFRVNEVGCSVAECRILDSNVWFLVLPLQNPNSSMSDHAKLGHKAAVG